MDMVEQPSGDDRWADLITAQQGNLYVYIFSLVHQRHDALDILQETNLVLWRKRYESVQVADFRAWAFGIAFKQVLAHRQRKAREKLCFNSTLLAQLAEDMASQLENEEEPYRLRLRQCVQKLPAHSRQLVAMRYEVPGSVSAMAEQLGRSTAAVSQALYRIRSQLLRCVRGLSAKEEAT
jgi:RNA polymerase sigma-70 factor, ECF subfamily